MIIRALYLLIGAGDMTGMPRGRRPIAQRPSALSRRAAPPLISDHAGATIILKKIKVHTSAAVIRTGLEVADFTTAATIIDCFHDAPARRRRASNDGLMSPCHALKDDHVKLVVYFTPAGQPLPMRAFLGRR